MQVVIDKLKIKQKNHLCNQDPEFHPGYANLSLVHFILVKAKGRVSLLLSYTVSRTKKKRLTGTEIIGALWIKPAFWIESIWIFEVCRTMCNAPQVDANDCLPNR
jgi:hypothetical protein